MATATRLTWEFPLKGVHFIRVERLFFVILLILVFLWSYFGSGNVASFAILVTIVFAALYLMASYAIQEARLAREKYTLTPTHFEVVRTTRWKKKAEKVPVKDIIHHKLDHTFLGGYMLSLKGKHLLFFNTRAEVEKFAKTLKDHLTPRKKIRSGNAPHRSLNKGKNKRETMPARKRAAKRKR